MVAKKTQLPTLHYIGQDLKTARGHIKRATHILDLEAPIEGYYGVSADRPSLPAILLVESELQEALAMVQKVLQQTELVE